MLFDGSGLHHEVGVVVVCVVCVVVVVVVVVVCVCVVCVCGRGALTYSSTLTYW